MTLEALTPKLGDEIEDPEEETFLLFSQEIPSQNLGFIDPTASSVEVVVHDREYTIHQSPTVLSSSRAGGTTGAVLWKINPIFASFISSPANPLFSSGILCPASSVLELGCGISPLNGLALAPHVSHILLTDQPYVQRLVSRNISENHGKQEHARARPAARRPPKMKAPASSSSSSSSSAPVGFATLDWETDQVTSELAPGPSGDFDLVLACDCVYNYALVPPLVQTCADACKLRQSKEDSLDTNKPCVCIVAQQLRSDEVFETWLTEFHKYFRVWRFPDNTLPEKLRTSAGFVVHAGILR
ncbi:unnamed protein product [Clonostachys chloroleuca]|uniref:Diaminohydroxyphosphoribosylamino-pyrimidine deaminase n=1 Tax=Clonostachys chloroleuca TaxID=1926264 RepID=A0AA35M3G4_9HYPO|nr:unnamed protein product [Clonostachys chloroleuca]